MKKIALLSVHSDPNFGSMLQAYALAATIKTLGYDCEYISYTNYVERPYFQRKIISLIKAVLPFFSKKETTYISSKDFKQQKKLFQQFHEKYIPYSSKKYNPLTISQANDCYDAFIVGSDQTWSPAVTAIPNTLFFLDFVRDNNKKHSYASSIGTTHISESYQQKLVEKLKDFKTLSCRENVNAELLSALLKRKVECVLDPTLLLTKQQWLEIAEPIGMPEKYVLCYILGEKKCISDFAEMLGRKKGLPVYYIVTQRIYLKKEHPLKYVSVNQFITLISKAAYVVTDSFHGTIFSANFGADFYSFAKRPNDGKVNDNDRIMDFLNRLGLANRFMDDARMTICEDVVYKDILDKLAELRSKSMLYLKNIIS